MNGIHDMGGMHGFGRVEPEPDEPVFHAPWEARAFGLALAAAPAIGYPIDAKRHAVERMGNRAYLESSYYERWLAAIETLALEYGVASAEELARGPVRGLARGRVEAALDKGRSKRRELEIAARFALGQRVRTLNRNPKGHTRLPRYARAKTGAIAHDRGVFAFADAMAAGAGERPQRVYSVRFEARELWGSGAPARQAVYLDLFESYLEA